MATVPAARHALRVLELLAEQVGPIRASVVARALDVPRSSVYQLLGAMRDEGFIVHYPELGAWGPSAKVHRIGSSVLAATRLEQLGQPVLDRLVAASSVPATAHLAVLAGTDVAYAARGALRRSPMTVSQVGVRLPAAQTATGRALLAALPHAQVRALLPHDASLAGTGVESRARLQRLLADVRSSGVATEIGDVDASYGSVAAAAHDAAGYPVVAIGLTFRLAAAGDAWDALAGDVRAAAAELTRRLSGRGRSS